MEEKMDRRRIFSRAGTLPSNFNEQISWSEKKMKKAFSLSDFKDLTIEERIELVKSLWDIIAEVPETIKLTEEQKRLLDERLAMYQKEPETGSSWEKIKKRIKGNE
jgi:putative addiction module component (TIGR02574 family)